MLKVGRWWMFWRAAVPLEAFQADEVLKTKYGYWTLWIQDSEIWLNGPAEKRKQAAKFKVVLNLTQTQRWFWRWNDSRMWRFSCWSGPRLIWHPAETVVTTAESCWLHKVDFFLGVLRLLRCCLQLYWITCPQLGDDGCGLFMTQVGEDLGLLSGPSTPCTATSAHTPLQPYLHVRITSQEPHVPVLWHEHRVNEAAWWEWDQMTEVLWQLNSCSNQRGFRKNIWSCWTGVLPSSLISMTWAFRWADTFPEHHDSSYLIFSLCNNQFSSKWIYVIAGTKQSFSQAPKVLNKCKPIVLLGQ